MGEISKYESFNESFMILRYSNINKLLQNIIERLIYRNNSFTDEKYHGGNKILNSRPLL